MITFLERFYSKKDCHYFHYRCFLLILFAKSIYAITFHSLHKIVLYLEALSTSIINTPSFLRHVFFLYIFFFTILQLICVPKDNHCSLASLPRYTELSLILHEVIDGFVLPSDYKSFLLNTLSLLILSEI